VGGTLPLQYSIDGGTSFLVDSVFPDLAAGNYDIAVSDVNSCMVLGSTVTILEPEPVVINSVTPTDVTGCAGDNNGALLVDVSGGTAPYEYSIDNGTSWQSDPDIVDLIAGTYIVMVRDQHTCTVTGDPVEIREPDAVTISSTVEDASCNSSTTGKIIIHATGGTGPYEYSIDGGTSFVSDSVFTDLSQGSYTLTARDANSCVSTNELVNVEEPDAILITSENATHTCLGEATGSVIVTANGGIGTLIYVLKKGANVVDQNSDGNFTGLKVGVYTVEVNDENNCGPVVSNNLQVKLSPTADCTIELYNAFSPNGDGINEKWTIYRIWNYPNATVKIYNSWGSLVFNSAVGYPEPWDGTYNGKALPAGTYYYIIDLDNGENPKSGTVNIIK
jgi:gliding motility-associated-like protein